MLIFTVSTMTNHNKKENKMNDKTWTQDHHLSVADAGYITINDENDGKTVALVITAHDKVGFPKFVERAKVNANLIADAPEMLNDLQSIAKIVNSAMSSSAYLRHDSDSYSVEKIRLYELCKTILALCR